MSAHPSDRVPPAALHLLEMPILGLDDEFRELDLLAVGQVREKSLARPRSATGATAKSNIQFTASSSAVGY
jgi:hypothetical protein